jgi:hypothetical protein
MTILLGASLLIIIAAAVFLVATRVLNRQIVQQETNVSGRAMPAQEFFADSLNNARTLRPDGKQLRCDSNASSGLLRDLSSGIGSMNTELEWAQAEQPTNALGVLTVPSPAQRAKQFAHQYDPSTAQLPPQNLGTKLFADHNGAFVTQLQWTAQLIKTSGAFATEPVPTESGSLPLAPERHWPTLPSQMS